LNTVDIHAKRDDIPFITPVLVQVNVGAHHRPFFARAAKTELDRRFRANAREIDGRVACTHNPFHAAVERLVENNPHVAVGPRTDQRNEQERESEGT
jgi:hypothetical protein